MLAATDAVAASLVDILAVLCKRVVRCGIAPSAMRMRLAVNMHLIATVTSVAETMNFARRSGLDTAQLQEVLLAGPMASDILRAKTNKLVKRDYATGALVDVILNNSELIVQSAREARVACPLMTACLELYQHASALG
jgi:3-hydroxyisobutyrate dehydrogenase